MGRPHQHVLCVRNRGCQGALVVRKVYRLVPDRASETRGLVRVIDDSGEDFLYPPGFFVAIEVPRKAISMFSKKSA